jgi:ubiquitin carboxyl-terminal hydrolase 16
MSRDSLSYWKIALYIAGVSTVVYIVAPSIETGVHYLNPFGLLFPGVDEMNMLRRKKKVGRHTVGLANRANDCFANSNLQALASLPCLYMFLNDIIWKASEDQALLSRALLEMIRELNEPILTPKTLSPWTLLVVLERIYKSRISRSQHDAHELLHLILETLENERNSIAKHQDEPEEVASFAFSGSTIDHITCSKCGYTPPVTPSVFLVLSLMVPQKRSVALNDLLTQLSNPEYIQDYGCARCKLRHKLASPPGQIPVELRQELDKYVSDPSKIPPELEAQLPRNLVSPIAKSTMFHKLPGILAIHLSRSIYGGFGASRNSCKVSSREFITLYEGEKPIKYKLMAMIRHKGTHQMGHYECFRRKSLSWWTTMATTRNTTTTTAKVDSMFVKSSSTNIPDSPKPPVNGATDASTPPAPPLTSSSSSSQEQRDSLENRSRSSVSSSSLSPQAAHTVRLPYPAERSLPSPASLSTTEFALPEITSIRADLLDTDVSPPSHHEWWKVSDDKVWECTTRDVLKEESGAYLLFYERQL